MPTHACQKHNLHWLGAHYLAKASCEISASSLKDLFGLSTKTHKLCIIMLINPSQFIFLEKIFLIFKKLCIEYIPSKFRPDYCITTDMMWKKQKCRKNISLKNRNPVHTIKPEPDFFQTYRFREVVDNVELITYMKFQKFLMTGCKDKGKKNFKIPHFWPPRFFQISGSVNFGP